MDIVNETGAAAGGGAFRARLSPGALAWAAASVAAALAAYLLLPALTPAHLEGFTAALAALGIHVAQGTLPAFDSLQPLNAEYYALTKLGAVLAVAAFVGPLQLDSDLALRLTMWIGFAALVTGSVLLARRWSSAGWWFVLPPLLLMPGIVESAFIYNDNVLSAGLAAIGLCLLYGRHPLSFVGAGLLLGLAVLTRTDTILACACVPVILFERFGTARKAAAALAAVGASAAASLLGPLAYFNASIFDVLNVGAAVVQIWNRPTTGDGTWIMVLYFLGFPGLVMAGFGLAALVRRKDALALVRLLCGPALLLAILADRIWEIRQLLALTPFLVTLAAIGLKLVYDGRETAARRWLRPAVAAVAIVALLGPMSGLRLRDGPRVLTGRVWAIPLWRTWQQAPRHDLAMLDRLVLSATPGTTLVLAADDWNEDRYLHLKLLDAGFAAADSASLAPPCRPIAERFTRGDREVLLMRLHHGVVPYWREIKEERLTLWGLPCLGSLPDAEVLFVASADHLRALLPAARAAPAFAPRPDDPRRDPLVSALSYGPIVALPLTPELRPQLLAAYRREAAALPRAPGERRPTLGDAVAATRKRTAFPG
ncbi:MAG TPA: hypothetical protein VN231_13400 [Allosphingosinicella sp.]|nr:hypothetical protein [Allosphingosinicella sp.]